MCIENWSKGVVLVNISDEAEPGEELANVAKMVRTRNHCDVVVDCRGVEWVSCTSRRWLLEMNDAVNSKGHRMILCGQRAKLKKALNAPAFTSTMGFAKDRFTALAGLGVPVK